MAGKKTLDDLLELEGVKALLACAERDMFPKMAASSVSLVIAHKNPDIKLALEIGAAILFDKPIIVVVFPGREVAPGLRRVADRIVEIDMESPDSRQKFKLAVEDLLGKGA